MCTLSETVVLFSLSNHFAQASEIINSYWFKPPMGDNGKMFSTGRELMMFWLIIHNAVVRLTEERLKQLLIDTERAQYTVSLQPFW